MRQVKARLLKFNGLYGDDSSDDDQKLQVKRDIKSSTNIQDKSEQKISAPPLINQNASLSTTQVTKKR